MLGGVALSSLSLLELLLLLLLLLRADVDGGCCGIAPCRSRPTRIRRRRRSTSRAGEHSCAKGPLADFLPLDLEDTDDTEKEWTNHPRCTSRPAVHEVSVPASEPEEHAAGDDEGDQRQQEHATTKRSRQRCQSASHGAKRVIVGLCENMAQEGITITVCNTQAAERCQPCGTMQVRHRLTISTATSRATRDRVMRSSFICEFFES